jgi:hypothetical protein
LSGKKEVRRCEARWVGGIRSDPDEHGWEHWMTAVDLGVGRLRVKHEVLFLTYHGIRVREASDWNQPMIHVNALSKRLLSGE